MKLPPSLFLALRYLRPKWSFVSVITILSVLGPAIGVWVLIVVISVMSGFQREIRQRIFGMNAHLQLQLGGGQHIAEPGPLIARLRELGIRATPVVQGPVLLQTRRQIEPRIVKGIDPATDRDVTVIAKSMKAGRYDLAEGEALIGRDLALNYGLRLGDKLILHPTGRLQKMVRFNERNEVEIVQPDEVYLPDEVTVVGIFAIDMNEVDANFIIVHLEKADELFDLPWGAAESLQIWVEDPFNLTPVLARLAQEPLFQELRYVTWQEANKQLFGALQVEKNMQFFMLLMVVVVAAFCIVCTLITIVVQKTREIGVLKATGATPWTICCVFLFQGGTVGALGVGAGTVAGLLTTWYRNEIAGLIGSLLGIEVFPAALYQLAEIPAHIEAMDIVRIAGSTLVISVLAAVIPALYAASMTASRAIKTEAG